MEQSVNDTSPQKNTSHLKDDSLILVILVFMIAVYMLAGLLVTPIQNANACGDDNTIVHAATNGAIETRKQFCVYKTVVKQTCVKINERFTVCDNELINNLLQQK